MTTLRSVDGTTIGNDTLGVATDDDDARDDDNQEYTTGGPLCPPIPDEALPKHWAIVYDPTGDGATISLKGKEYMQVAQRMVWFVAEQRELIRKGLALTPFGIRTRLVAEREGWAEYEATVTDVFGNSCTMSGSESVKDFPDYREKAQTKAAGRALLGIGYGTAFAPDELDEGKRIVDSPVARRASSAARPQPTQRTQPTQQAQRAAPARPSSTHADPNDGQKLATEQQLTSIGKLCAALNRDEPDKGISYEQARQLLTTLSADYQQQRRAQQSTSAEK